ncbi:serine/threonine-protein phosphatase 7 long form homolog [Lycium ferocissimum]|uniref:serine/threonine-protein phosphatase 7 long form homolog n=1 Tax=Lycium ferocissimum TaxID=112874 RepID=UPI002815CDDF|nr:serine/threonine-protein phosphatase 7 long form homolog [Lycium ferocissimum]
MSLRYPRYIDDLAEIGCYSWVAAVLSYMYRGFCRCSMGTRVEVPAFCSLLQIWVWTRLRPFQPISAHPPADYLTVLMPYVRRWSRGVRRRAESYHSLLPFRDQLDRMTAQTAFIWTPYDRILDELPAFCRAGQHMWMSRCPLIHMDIVEYHVPDRVLRQFGYVQNIPAATDWEHDHYAMDERAGVDDAWRLHMQRRVQSRDELFSKLAGTKYGCWSILSVCGVDHSPHHDKCL